MRNKPKAYRPVYLNTVVEKCDMYSDNDYLYTTIVKKKPTRKYKQGNSDRLRVTYDL